MISVDSEHIFVTLHYKNLFDIKFTHQGVYLCALIVIKKILVVDERFMS